MPNGNDLHCTNCNLDNIKEILRDAREPKTSKRDIQDRRNYNDYYLIAHAHSARPNLKVDCFWWIVFGLAAYPKMDKKRPKMAKMGKMRRHECMSAVHETAALRVCMCVFMSVRVHICISYIYMHDNA